MKDKWGAYLLSFKRLRCVIDQIPGILFVAIDIHRNKFVIYNGFHEVISSGVGVKEKNTMKPINNYGIIKFDNSGVTVALNGRDRKSKRIKLSTSKLIRLLIQN